MSQSESVGADIGISLELGLNLSLAKCLYLDISVIALKQSADNFYVFDAHCRRHNGLCDPEGKSTVTCHNYFEVLCMFLRHPCMSLSCISLENVQFEISASLSTKPRKPVTQVFTQNCLIGEGQTESRKSQSKFIKRKNFNGHEHSS